MQQRVVRALRATRRQHRPTCNKRRDNTRRSPGKPRTTVYTSFKRSREYIWSPSLQLNIEPSLKEVLHGVETNIRNLCRNCCENEN